MNRQEYYLTHLMEECSEVIKNCSKALRFGLDSAHPKNPNKTNRESILDELDDIKVLTELMIYEGILTYKAKWYDNQVDRWLSKAAKQEEKYKLSVSLGTIKDE